MSKKCKLNLQTANTSIKCGICVLFTMCVHVMFLLINLQFATNHKSCIFDKCLYKLVLNYVWHDNYHNTTILYFVYFLFVLILSFVAFGRIYFCLICTLFYLVLSFCCNWKFCLKIPEKKPQNNFTQKQAPAIVRFLLLWKNYFLPSPLITLSVCKMKAPPR